MPSDIGDSDIPRFFAGFTQTDMIRSLSAPCDTIRIFPHPIRSSPMSSTFTLVMELDLLHISQPNADPTQIE